MKTRIQPSIELETAQAIEQYAIRQTHGNISKAIEVMVKKFFNGNDYSKMSDLELLDEMQNIKDELEKRKAQTINKE